MWLRGTDMPTLASWRNGGFDRPAIPETAPGKGPWLQTLAVLAEGAAALLESSPRLG